MGNLQYKKTPYLHQKEILEETKDKEYWGWFLEQGLGKSAMALVNGVYLWRCNQIKGMLIITKNGVDDQFVEEAIPDHLPLQGGEYFAEAWHSSGEWRKFKKFSSTVKNRFIILAINCEALQTKRGLAAITKFAQSMPCFLIVDESQEFSGLTAQRTKNLKKIAPMFPFRRLMSGTPSGGNPMHYLPQMDILSPRIFGIDRWSYEKRYCVKEEQEAWVKLRDKAGNVVLNPATGKAIPVRKTFEVVTGYKNLEQLQDIISRYSSRRTKDECLDLPPKLYTKMYFDLSPEERKLYDSVKNSILAELAPGKFISSELAITKLIRLQQIACGFAVFEDLVTGERGKTLLAKPSRIEALLQRCSMVKTKTLIWSRFTTSTDQIIAALSEVYGPETIVRYDGTVGPEQKQKNKLAFKREAHIQWLVGNPKAGGVGLDLPEAENAFYYSNDYHLISRLQSEDRCHRIGTIHPVTYVDFIANNTVDDKILKALRNHYDIASKLSGDELKRWIS